ncbi:unnamed protein product [Spirodela intermedia]|uniref:Leucine-rich repeat-containing N-terminal plant-type domain-containing protein n=1 Tax=Spirodela intermedia TaxID=51605 RepID=A0A7I8JFW6_SPIIN|nr:unnamed protein product [Spirodela intermedia]CAA6669050.1 unnamed protein product [Spirodela intermedia]
MISFLATLFSAVGMASAVGLLDPVDFLALQSVRMALDDMPGSHFFTSWDFSRDPCLFSGVFCSGNRVVALSLGDPRAGSPGLLGRLDPAIGELSALAELSVVPGRVIGSLPSTIGRLTNLRFLAISRNFLTGSIPPGIGALHQLRTLDLSFNQLSGPIPPGLAGIPSLSNIILSHNHLSGSVPSLHSPSLVRLDLSNNNLSGGIVYLPVSLQYLSLSWNRLSGPIDRVLPLLACLNYIDLSMNLFTGPIPPACVDPDSRCQLQPPLREISPMFSSVRRLFLNNNLFSGPVPAKLVARLLDGGIQILYLQHNYLTGIQISPSSEVPRRSSLCLQYNCMLPPAQTSCPSKLVGRRSAPLLSA